MEHPAAPLPVHCGLTHVVRLHESCEHTLAPPASGQFASVVHSLMFAPPQPAGTFPPMQTSPAVRQSDGLRHEAPVLPLLLEELLLLLLDELLLLLLLLLV